MKKQYIVIMSVLILIAIFASGVFVFRKQQSEKYDFMAQENASTFVREHSLTLGSDDAKVYIVEFFDPACETCGAFYPLVKQILAENDGKIKLVVRYAPFHEGADYFVRILEAARKQGKYWGTLEVMYKTQPYWASHHNPQPQLIWPILYESGLGLDIDKLKLDMNDPEITKLIEQDIADANTLDVRKTPGFFVNGKPLVDFGYEQLLALVNQEIKANY